MLRSFVGALVALGPWLAPLGAQAAADPFPHATPESVGIPAAALAELKAEVDGYLARDLIVGAELLVIQDRKTVLHETFGMRDRELDEPWEIGTVCNIRSMTKPLTGAAAQLLIDRGELALDDPVARYLPGFDTDAARDITVWHLLTHRGGLPLTMLTSMDDATSLQDMGNRLGALGPEFPVDGKFWYSDGGTDALGAVVEVASGRPLGEFVHDELLVPLGMTDSFYFVSDDDPRRARIASLYAGSAGSWTRFLDPDDGAFYPFPWGSQSIYSTPRDYARFLAMWMDGGFVGDERLFSAAAMERMLTPVSAMSMLGSDARMPTAYRGLDTWYGQMAVLHVPVVAEGRGPATIVGHSGSDGTVGWAWPDLDLMVLYFTQSRGGKTTLRLQEAVDRLLVSPDAYANLPDAPPELRPYLGTYVADWSYHMLEEVTVEYRGGRFVFDVPSQLTFELVPKEGEPGHWLFTISPDLELWFERDADGAVDCLRIAQGPLVFEAPRKGTPHAEAFLAEQAVKPDEVAQLLGFYDGGEEGGLAEVFVDGRYLAVRAPTGDVFHLWQVPVEPLRWQVRQSPTTTLVFEQDASGRIVSVARHAFVGEPFVMPRVEDPPAR